MTAQLMVITILLLAATVGAAQTDTTYGVEFHSTVSPSFTVFDHERYEGAPNNVMVGAAITARMMWHPGRLLAVGVMSGYTRIASETLIADSSHNNGTPTIATLTSVPLQAVVSMQGRHLEVGVCMGPHLVMTTIDDGSPAYGSRIELNLTLLANYRWPIAEDLYVAPEIRVSYFSYRGVLSLLPSVTLRYDLLRY